MLERCLKLEKILYSILYQKQPFFQNMYFIIENKLRYKNMFSICYRCLSGRHHDAFVASENKLSSPTNVFTEWLICNCSLAFVIFAARIYSWQSYNGNDNSSHFGSHVRSCKVSLPWDFLESTLAIISYQKSKS